MWECSCLSFILPRIQVYLGRPGACWGLAFWNSIYKTTPATYRKELIPMEERIKGTEVALEQ